MVNQSIKIVCSRWASSYFMRIALKDLINRKWKFKGRDYIARIFSKRLLLRRLCGGFIIQCSNYQPRRGLGASIGSKWAPRKILQC